MSRGGEAGPSPQTVDTRVLWHFGLMPHDDKACVSNGDVSRVLHVDAREDRLVEIVDARITRVIPLDDLVSYSLEEEIEGEGGDDAGFFLDEAEEGMRWREKTTITLTVRNAVDKELHCVEYRVQSISETRALRGVLERLSLGGDEALADDTTTRSQHEDENKARRAGTLMRRRGRVALSERQTWSGNETAGGRWTTCAAVCVGRKLILMAKPPVGGGDDGDAGDVYTQTCEGQRRSQKTVKTVKGTARNLPAPAIATGGRAVSLSIHAVFCLENARVVKRRAKWNDGGDGEFDIVCNAGRVVLAVPRGGAAERDAWIEALCEGARYADRQARRGVFGVGHDSGFETAFFETGTKTGTENGTKPPNPVLDSATRALVSEAKRLAGAVCFDFGIAKDVSDGETDEHRGDGETRRGDDGDENTGKTRHEKRNRVLVLDRFWRHATLGVSAHFLFSFSVRVLGEEVKTGEELDTNTTGEGSTVMNPRVKTRVLLHVDVAGHAVVAYAGCSHSGDFYANRPRHKKCATVARSVETKHVELVRVECVGSTEETTRHRHQHVLRLAANGRGVFPKNTNLGLFSFQTGADKDVFASLVVALRDGIYEKENADRYHFRNLIKRGVETGVRNGDTCPARYLVLVPGKLLVLRGDRGGVPLQTASLAEGATVAALRQNANVLSADASGGTFASNFAIVTLALPHDKTFQLTFRFATIDVAKAWARAIAEAAASAGHPRRETKNTPDAHVEPGAEETTQPDSPLSPGGVPNKNASPVPPPSPPSVARETPPSPRRRSDTKAVGALHATSRQPSPAPEASALLALTYFEKEPAGSAALTESALRDARFLADAEAKGARARLREAKNAEVSRELARRRAETEARESFARAEARAETRLALEYELQAAAVRVSLETSARERAGVAAAAKTRAEAKEKLRALEQARAFAEAEETARALAETKAAAQKIRAEALAAAEALAVAEAKAEAQAKAEAAARDRIEAEERAAARARVDSERAVLARIKEEENAVRRVQSENEYRLAVRARVEAEERERWACETRAHENVRARLEAEKAAYAEKTRRALAAENTARARFADEELAAENAFAAESALITEKLAEAERRSLAAEAAAAEATSARDEAQAAAAAATRSRADVLAAEVAAAVLAGDDPFAATRANSIASPASTREDPLSPYSPYSPYATRPPPSPPRRMNDAFFSLARPTDGGANSRRLGVLESPPDSPPPAFQSGAGAGARASIPNETAAPLSNLSFKLDELDRGARLVRPSGRHPPRSVGSSSSSSASATSSRSSSPDRTTSRASTPPSSPPVSEFAQVSQSASRPSKSVDRQLGFETREIAAEAAHAEPDRPGAASVADGARAQSPRPSVSTTTFVVPEGSDRQRQFRVPAVAPSEPTDTAFTSEGATRAASFVVPPARVSSRNAVAKNERTEKETLPVPHKSGHSSQQPSSSQPPPPTHFLAAAAEKAAFVSRPRAPPSPLRRLPSHPRASPSLPKPMAPVPATDAGAETKKKSMIKSMFKGMFSSSSAGGGRKKSKK